MKNFDTFRMKAFMLVSKRLRLGEEGAIKQKLKVDNNYGMTPLIKELGWLCNGILHKQGRVATQQWNG